MMNESALAELQMRLFVASLSSSMVYLLHQEIPEDPGSGTAVLVNLDGRTYIASALHNFDLKQTGDLAAIVKVWNETRFSFRDGGTLDFHDQLALPQRMRLDVGTEVSITTTPLIDREFDLIAVRLDPGRANLDTARPISLAQYSHTGEIRPGAQLTTVGIPLSGALPTEGGAHVAYPHTFIVPFDPNVPKPAVKSEHKSDDYLLYRYADHFKGCKRSWV